MNISLLRSDVIYRKMINVPKEKREVDETQQKQIQLISEDCLWNECKKTIEKGLECFTKAGYELPVKDYLFALMLANPKSPYVSLSDGYLGDGGIPGYALLCSLKTKAMSSHLFIPYKFKIIGLERTYSYETAFNEIPKFWDEYCASNLYRNEKLKYSMGVLWGLCN